MSEPNSPVSVVFDLQRNAIEQTHKAVTRGVETQQHFGETLVDFEPAKQTTERSYEAVRTVGDVYFDAVESAMPGQQDLLADVRAAVDDQLDTLEATQVETIEAVETNVQEASAAADDSRAEFITALDEQFEAVLDAHEAIEAQTVEAFDGVEGDLEALQAEFEAHSEEAAEQSEAQLKQFTEQLAELQQQIADVNGELTETVAQQVETHVEAADNSLETIDGLGATYADRLQAQGIESLDVLAETNADTVAEAADVTEEKAQVWIDAAQPEA